MPFGKKSKIAAVSGAAVLALATMSGCGEDATPTTTPTTTPTAASTTPTATTTTTPTATPKPATVPEEGDAALESAESYLDTSGFSEDGLRKQLKFEEFPKAAIDYALKNVEVDWNAEAVETAESYLDMGGMSKAGLRDQLKFEGFTKSQIDHALKNAKK